MKRPRIFLLLLLTWMAGFVYADERADTLYVNGKIYTVTSDHPWAEAMAVRGDRFVYVGDGKGAERWRGKRTRVVDLKGAFVIPGMYDMHVHPDLLFEPKYTDQIQTEPLGPVALKKAILNYAARHPGDEWIFGGTWSPDQFTQDGVEPGAGYLDSFVPDRPVAILDAGRHILIVNSKGMKLADIDANVFTPEHGVIRRDTRGNPTGYFGDGAQSLFSHVLPQGGWREFMACYKEAAQMLNRYGFIAARAQHVNTPRLQGVAALEHAGELTVRYDMAISWKNDLYFSVDDRPALLTGERFRYRSKHVNANYVKLHLDGTVQGYTGYFLESYRDTKNNYGKTNESRRELYDMLVQLERQRIAANIHVIGDAAARLALDAVEHARKVVGLPRDQQPRHMLAHTYFIQDADARRLASLNMAAEYSHNVMHPALKKMMDFLRNKIVSEEAAPYLINIRPALASGGKAVFGSDLVVAPDPNVFPALSQLARRDDPKASITLEQALRMLTINGAWAMGIEKDAGNIEVGKYADFIVLDRNLFKIPVEKIADTQVRMTVFEGDMVFDADEAGAVKTQKRNRTLDVFSTP